MASSNNEKKAIPNERLPKDRVEEAYDPDWLVGTSAEKMFKSPIKTKQISPSKNSDFSDPVYKQLSRLNGRINRMSIDELTGTLGDLDLDSSGKKEVLIKRLKSHYKEKSLEKVSKNGLTAAEDALVSELSTKPAAETVTGIKVPKCPYDYVCVIDYEATCTETKIEDYPHEIIEFPVVLINMATLTIVKLSLLTILDLQCNEFIKENFFLNA
jgi:3'-5' exoribonuclease 1